jgi:hypothetical protein
MISGKKTDGNNMNNLEVKKCVLEIFDSLCDKSGFDDWWYNLDDGTQEDIESSIEEIIKKRLGTNEQTR